MFSLARSACSATPASESAASPSAHRPSENHVHHCRELIRHSATPSEPTRSVPRKVFPLWQDSDLTTLEKALAQLFGGLSAPFRLVLDVGKPI